MKAQISQRTARAYKRRCERLEQMMARQRNCWSSDFGDGWVHLATVEMDAVTHSAIRTARKLSHAVVAVPEWPGNSVRFYAAVLRKEIECQTS